MRACHALMIGLVLVAALPRPVAAVRTEVDFVSENEAWPDIDHDFVSDLVITADGRHVYASAFIDRAVAHFTRDPEFGHLTFVGKTAAGTMDGTRLVLSPDERFVYVSSQYYGRIARLSRDTETGELTWVDGYKVSGLRLPRALAISPDGAHIYAGSADIADPAPERRASGLTVFARDEATGELDAVAKYVDDRDGIDGLHEPSEILVSPDGAYVYTLSRGDHAVGVFARDPMTGLLDYRGIATAGLDGLSPLGADPDAALSPDGRSLYVTIPDQHALAQFDRDAASGALTLRHRYSDDDPGFEGLASATDVVVAPDGTAVYAMNSGVVQMIRDVTSGDLTPRAIVEPDCWPQYRTPVFSPDGTYIVASNPTGRGLAGASMVVLRVNDPLAPPLCGPTPRPHCAAAERTRLSLRTDADPTRRRLRWDWRGAVAADPTGPPPRAVVGHAFCLYVDDGTPQLRAAARADAGYPCNPPPWRRTRGYLLFSAGGRDPWPDGLGRVRIGAAPPGGTASHQVQGKGAHLQLPLLPIADGARVIAQLVNRSGDCWESVFTAPSRSSATIYRADQR